MKFLYENDIDSIITNYPDVARKIINNSKLYYKPNGEGFE